MDEQNDMATEALIAAAKQDMEDLAELSDLVGVSPDDASFFQEPVTASQYADKLDGLANRLNQYASHIRRTADKKGS